MINFLKKIESIQLRLFTTINEENLLKEKCKQIPSAYQKLKIVEIQEVNPEELIMENQNVVPKENTSASKNLHFLKSYVPDCQFGISRLKNQQDQDNWFIVAYPPLFF